jgi:hypothetical protein
MSFVPAPQASAANAASSSANNAPVTNSSVAASAAAEGEAENLLFKLRTYDIYWVEKTALMYRDGFDKVSWVIVMFEFIRLENRGCSTYERYLRLFLEILLDF